MDMDRTKKLLELTPRDEAAIDVLEKTIERKGTYHARTLRVTAAFETHQGETERYDYPVYELPDGRIYVPHNQGDYLFADQSEIEPHGLDWIEEIEDEGEIVTYLTLDDIVRADRNGCAWGGESLLTETEALTVELPKSKEVAT